MLVTKQTLAIRGPKTFLGHRSSVRLPFPRPPQPPRLGRPRPGIPGRGFHRRAQTSVERSFSGSPVIPLLFSIIRGGSFGLRRRRCPAPCPAKWPESSANDALARTVRNLLLHEIGNCASTWVVSAPPLPHDPPPVAPPPVRRRRCGAAAADLGINFVSEIIKEFFHYYVVALGRSAAASRWLGQVLSGARTGIVRRPGAAPSYALRT